MRLKVRSYNVKVTLKVKSMKKTVKSVAVKSSEVKRDLRATLKRVGETGQDILIEYSGEVHARLTTRKPQKKVAPVRLRVEDARQNWSKLMQVVATRDARFVFRLVNSPAVFLLRDSEYQNGILHQWNEHIKKHRLTSATAGTAEAFDEAKDEIIHQIHCLDEVVKQLSTTVRTAFASLTRTDLRAFPETGLVPRRNEGDLERYEVD